MVQLMLCVVRVGVFIGRLYFARGCPNYIWAMASAEHTYSFVRTVCSSHLFNDNVGSIVYVREQFSSVAKRQRE